MNWDNAKLFIAVARTGQIAAASKILNMSQATLSRRITALETSLDVKLLVRRTFGCELTEEGKAFYKSVERAETELLNAQSQFQKIHSKTSGVVRIGAPDGFGVGFLASKLPILLNEYPDLKIQLVPVPRSFSLSQREADIAIMVGRPEKGRLIIKKLTDYNLSLYASKNYIAEFGKPSSLSQLSDHRLIGYVNDLIYSEALVYTNEFIRNWRSSLEVSSSTGQVEAVKASAGIGILHDYLASHDDNLVRLFPSSTISRSYWLAYHEAQKDLDRIKIVSQFITTVTQQEKARFSALNHNENQTNTNLKSSMQLQQTR